MAKPKKHNAQQLLLTPLVHLPSEPHKIVRCAACDEAKYLEFHRLAENHYYICNLCGFQSGETTLDFL